MSNDMKLERSELDMKMLAAWLNVSVDQIPPENRAHHNPVTMEAWRRVGEAAIRHASETTRHQPQREAVLEGAVVRTFAEGLWAEARKRGEMRPEYMPPSRTDFLDEARKQLTSLTTPAPAVSRDDQALLADIFANMAEVLKPLPGELPNALGAAGTRATESGDGDEA